MPILARLRSLWRNLLHRTHADAELDDELRAYVALLAEEYERAGMTADDALRRARIETGGVQQVKESTREAWVGNQVATLVRELRYAMRSLRRSPAFVVIAITTLALGIGGATAVFTVIKGSLLRPLPAVMAPDRLVSVETQQMAEFSPPDYRDLREHATTLRGLAAYNGTSMAIKGAPGIDTRAWVSYVSDNFFTVLGVHPAMGRFFGASGEGMTGELNNQVVVLSYDWWQRNFAENPNVIGSALTLDGHLYTIIGVAPRGFIGAMALHTMEMWIPLAVGNRSAPPLAAFGMRLESRRLHWLRLVGRLAPGKTVEDAQRELAVAGDWLAATYPSDRGRIVKVLPGVGMTAEERTAISRVPRLLAMAVALLLFIACGNVASLSLVRATARRRELATRIALGASRATLVRQVVVEGSVLAVGAGLLGIVVAQALVHSAPLVDTVVPMPGIEIGLDGLVLGVAIGASALTAILVSALPALQIFHVQPGAALKDGGGAVRGSSAGGQRTLVAGQVAASLVMLSAAAIIFSAFHRVLDAQDALDPQGLTDVAVDVMASIHDTAQQVAFYRAVLARAAAEPGIAGAAVTSTIPPFEWSEHVSVFRRGEEPPPGALLGHERELGLRVDAVEISPDFFDVMRLPVLRGRPFSASDNEHAPPVVIVSHRLAEALWPGEDPIGRYLSWPTVEGPSRPPLRVVGVVTDTRNASLTAIPLTMYVPFVQHPGSDLTLILRTHGNSPVAPSTFRRIVADIDPGVAVFGVRTLLDRLQEEVQPQRTASEWIAVFGMIALLLATIGLYGVMAQAVLQRTRELAVRSALGASPGGILRTVLGDGLRLATIGGAVGALGAFIAFRVLRSIFTGVQLTDMRAVIVAAFTLAIAMLAATYLPARRAARLNPVDALRSD